MLLLVVYIDVTSFEVERGWLTAWVAEFLMMTVLALTAGFLVYCGDLSGTKTAGLGLQSGP